MPWDSIFSYVGFPAFLKPFDGGGWRDVYKVNSPEEFFNAYDQTRDLCMTLQRGVKFKEYFRCYVVGQEKVHIMQYDPSAPFHERYVKNPPPVDPKLLARVERDCLTLCRALGYDLNTVEFACEDGIPYAIDFMNPAPDADVNSVGQANFDWIVNAVAELAVRKAKAHTGEVREYRWSASLAAERGTRKSSSRNLAGKGLIANESAELQHWHRRGISDHRSGNARSALAHRLGDSVQGKLALSEAVKPEMHQSVIEVGTRVCKDIQEARENILELRREMITLAS